jgi:hypothetical protein
MSEDSQTDHFFWGSFVESPHWMVLHRPVELAAVTGQVKSQFGGIVPLGLMFHAKRMPRISPILARISVCSRGCWPRLAVSDEVEIAATQRINVLIRVALGCLRVRAGRHIPDKLPPPVAPGHQSRPCAARLQRLSSGAPPRHPIRRLLR